MARLFTEGFEAGDLLGLPYNTGSGNVKLESTTVRSGAYSVNVSGSSYYFEYSFSGISEVWARVGFNSSNINNAVKLISWFNGTTELGSVRHNSAKMEAYTGTGTLVASGTTVLQPNTWYLLEIHVKIADAGGTIEVKLDGNNEASFSGDTKPGTATTVTSLRFGSANTMSVNYDDLAIDDAAWIGDGHIIALLPNAAGDKTDLTPSAGSNYQNVDERPIDSDTTYNESATADQYDLYNLAACGLSNVTITRVWAEARARDTVAAGGNCQLGLKTESTEYWSSNISLLTTYTKQLLGTAYTLNPNTSSAWTTTQLDALQAGFKVK